MSFSSTTELSVSLRLEGGDRAVGRLALVGRRILFELDPTFLASPLPISPVELPVRSGVHEERTRVFDGLYGVFDDSLPDSWGRLLLDREMDRVGVGRSTITPLDRLAWVGAHGAGALVYEPAVEVRTPTVVDLRSLAADARLVLDGDERTVLSDLLALGGSSGGARPKVSVSWSPTDRRLAAGPAAEAPGFVPVIVKFPARNDPEDAGRIEYAYAIMAKAAGIDVSPVWLLATEEGPGYFATQRFDRGPRAHVHTLCGLLHADHRTPSLGYADLLKVTRWLTRDQRQVDQMFRRMVFNVLANNRDDHSRNFAFLMDAAGRWRVSPAYDLTFSSGPGGEHWMSVAGEGRNPGVPHMLAVAAEAGVDKRQAERIIEGVREAVARWGEFAREAEVGSASMGRVAARVVAHCATPAPGRRGAP